MAKNIDWEQIVNGLAGPFPEVGLAPPQIETEDTDVPTGEFYKLSMIVYFFTDDKTGKTYTTQKHWLTEYPGSVNLDQVKEVIKKDYKKGT